MQPIILDLEALAVESFSISSVESELVSSGDPTAPHTDQTLPCCC